jgi:hypothetical protein
VRKSGAAGSGGPAVRASGKLALKPPSLFETGFGRFNFMLDHVSVLFMKGRILNADLGPVVNRASLLCAAAFAVIAAAFRCSADRFRCYRITAKTLFKTLYQNRNISNKSPEKAPEKISFAVLSLFRPNNSENSLSLAETFRRHSGMAPLGRKSRFTRRRKGAKTMSGRIRHVQRIHVPASNARHPRLVPEGR